MSPLLTYLQTPYLYLDVDKYCDYRYTDANTNEPQNLAKLELPFTRDELVSYTEYRKAGLAKKSLQWLEKASHLFWLHTNGSISKDNLDALRCRDISAIILFLSETSVDPA